jgi:hypothetical protein
VPALAARHEADVGQPRLEPAPQRRQLVAPVARDHHPEVAGSRLEVPAHDRAHVERELRAEAQQRVRDRQVALDEHARGAHDRLEEDLDRAA